LLPYYLIHSHPHSNSPLVVTELDGLASNDSQLGTAATNALNYLTGHLRSHATSLKVQTSRGNYLSSLSVRREQVDLRDALSWERNMDDLILRAAIWQDEHWVDRSALLKSAPAAGEASASAAKVVLLSFDRNREYSRSQITISI
jgi:protein SMG6